MRNTTPALPFRKPWFFVTVFVSILILNAAPSAWADTAKILREAEEHFSRGEYLEALDDYQSVVDEGKKGELDAKALMMTGVIYGSFLNDRESALKRYAAVRTKYPGTLYEADALFNAATISFDAGRYRDASALFGSYLKKFPNGSKRDIAAFMRDACDNPLPKHEAARRPQAPAAAGTAQAIRVLVAENVSEAVITCSDVFRVKCPGPGTEKRFTKPAAIQYRNGMFVVDGASWTSAELRVVAEKNGPLCMNGKWYRGDVALRPTGNGRMAAVNVIDVESYLYGVVTREMPANWPEEALKAQAVISRTFALYHMDANAGKNWHVSATTAGQVYGGLGAESDKARRAVDATRGMVLTYAGKPALTYFHANSGGRTEDARNVWRVAIPYLQSIEDEDSLRAPNATWSAFVSHGEMQSALGRGGFSLGDIEAVETDSQSPTGRVMRIRIRHSRGSTLLSGSQFRAALGAEVIKSTLFSMRPSGNGVAFEGRGSGHGVGLSQWGARIKAEGGSPCREILLHYYRGLELVTN